LHAATHLLTRGRGLKRTGVLARKGVGRSPAHTGGAPGRRQAVLIYRQTGDLRAVQLLLGHSKIESTVRYLGIEVDDAIEIAEKIDNWSVDAITPTADTVGGALCVADCRSLNGGYWDFEY